MPPSIPKKIEEAHRRFLFCANSEGKQRTAELDDLRFAAGYQWPDDIKLQRQGDSARKIPPRPCLTINRLLGPLDQVTNLERMADFSGKVAPNGGAASQATAEVFKGILRSIQVDSRAPLARNWAGERAAKCGRGFWRITAEYDHDPDVKGPEAWDQSLKIKRILNQANVFMDPSAQEPDWCDADWAIITNTLTEDRYQARFGSDTQLGKLSLNEWVAIGTMYPGWLSTDEKGTRTIRIAEYFTVKDVESGTVKDPDTGGTRTLTKRTVEWCVINAVEELELHHWPGCYIPIITLVGREDNVDGERIYSGIVRPAKDAQRSYNYMRSADVERYALLPKAPIIAAAGQLEQFKPFWDQMNTANFGYLPYDPMDVQGHLVPEPHRLETGNEGWMQASGMLKMSAADDIRVTTGVPQVSLGELDPGHRSGKAIKELKQQSELGTSAYLDNLRLAVEYETRVLVDLIPHYYDRPGRVVKLLDLENDQTSAVIKQHYQKKPDGTAQMGPNGQPVTFPPGPDGQPQIPQGVSPDQIGYVDLSAGRYCVTVEVGKGLPTRREEGAQQMGALSEAAPQLVPVYADLWVGDMDFPGAKKIAARLAKANPLAKDDSQQPDPQQLQQQLQHASMLVQKLGEELNAKNQIIQTDQLKLQTEVQIAQINAQASIERARIAAASAGQVAIVKADSDKAEAILDAEVKAAQLRVSHADTLLETQTHHADTLLAHHQDVTEAEKDRSHAVDLAAMQPDPARGGDPASA